MANKELASDSKFLYFKDPTVDGTYTSGGEYPNNFAIRKSEILCVTEKTEMPSRNYIIVLECLNQKLFSFAYDSPLSRRAAFDKIMIFLSYR